MLQALIVDSLKIVVETRANVIFASASFLQNKKCAIAMQFTISSTVIRSARALVISAYG